MEYLKLIYEILISRLDIGVILIVISLGEIIKKYWNTKRITAFFKVLIPTLPFVLIYSYMLKIEPNIVLLSYLISFWLYPFIVKWILIKLGLKEKEVLSSSNSVGGEIPDTDDEESGANKISKRGIGGEIPDTDDET